MALMFAYLVLSLSILTLVAGCDHCYRFDYKFDDNVAVWFKYHRVPVTWAEARMQCHAEGAVLASPLTNELKAAIISFVQRQTKSKKGTVIFTGVHATYAKGVYTSVEGVPLLRLAVTWAPGEPNNYKNSESCLTMLIEGNGTMADAKCDNVLPYVCYKKYEPLTYNECGTSDKGYVLQNKTGSCYKFHSKILSWSEAYKTCESEGAYLAIINNDVEAEVVRNILEHQRSNNFRSIYPHNHYIGYHDWGQTHNFMTIHGQTLDEAGYQKWVHNPLYNTSIPETNDFGQGCGGVNTNGKLNNVHCNLPHTFLCEMSPQSLS